MFGTIPEFNQSLEMFKTMWGQGAAAQAGQFPFSADASKAAGGFGAAFPGLDVDELEKRIKEKLGRYMGKADVVDVTASEVDD